MTEIATLMNRSFVNTFTHKWIEYRGTALKNVMDSMTAVERQVLEDLAEKWRLEGLPKEIQRK
jgi:hypothetical protein